MNLLKNLTPLYLCVTRNSVNFWKLAGKKGNALNWECFAAKSIDKLKKKKMAQLKLMPKIYKVD